MDFIFDRTANGRPLKIFSLIDEYTRECIALEVGRKFDSDDLVHLLVDLFLNADSQMRFAMVVPPA